MSAGFTRFAPHVAALDCPGLLGVFLSGNSEGVGTGFTGAPPDGDTTNTTTGATQP
ncbi:MAG: hypothetical protein GF416_01440 [Candidatus Altiarchaeales archaeon]|nr:hypothetical protein [Candidatus Altiarchaeales archaeon]MBD3415778.1 hypothetical protein [Candidatus Altiarchaeales archaeon]